MPRRHLRFWIFIILVAGIANAADSKFDVPPSLPDMSVVSDSNGTEIYIHIRSENQQSTATRIKNSLEEKGYTVPRILVVSSGPRAMQMRYFHDDRDQASRIVHDMDDLKLGPIAIESIPNYEKTMPPKRYELWLAPNTP
jgi:hypothetical protein